ncbi:MAG TPA: tetratricopeptide repeat protein [Burkholderiales bacterium]|jgi:tetratricopeptide (TPR) repeat protein
MTGTEVEILGLIAARRSRRPVRDLAALAQLFRRLGKARASAEALETEDRIWGVWMHHPHRGAAGALEAATRDIAARRYDIAETRLTALLRSAPLYAEAWHKRATLYYLLGRDAECLRDIQRTLELEPRHFAAMLHFAEILLGEGAGGEARYAFAAALSLHPHLPRARDALADKA